MKNFLLLALEWYPGQRRSLSILKLRGLPSLVACVTIWRTFLLRMKKKKHHDNLWVFLSDDNTIGVNRSLHHLPPHTFLATVYHSNSASKILLPKPSIQFFMVRWMVITKFQSSHDLLLCQFACCCWSTIENFLTNFIALMVDACAREVVLIDIKPIKMFVICVFFLIYQIQIQLGSAYEKKILGGLEAWDCNLIMYYYGVWHDTFSQIYYCNLLWLLWGLGMWFSNDLKPIAKQH